MHEKYFFFGIPLLHKPTVKFRVEIFKEYAAKRKESVWTQLLTLLNRPVGFIMNMTARVIAKMACWSRDLMQGADLQVCHKCAIFICLKLFFVIKNTYRTSLNNVPS